MKATYFMVVLGGLLVVGSGTSFGSDMPIDDEGQFEKGRIGTWNGDPVAPWFGSDRFPPGAAGFARNLTAKKNTDFEPTPFHFSAPRTALSEEKFKQKKRELPERKFVRGTRKHERK